MRSTCQPSAGFTAYVSNGARLDQPFVAGLDDVEIDLRRVVHDLGVVLPSED
jgi:hypothetical protein